MTPQLPVRRTPTQEPTSNGWETLLPLLDPVVINTPRARNAWPRLDRRAIYYLTHTIAKFPWLNQLALAVVIATEQGIAQPLHRIASLHVFLRWAIPKYYPDVASLKPVEALIAFFGDPPQPRGDQACRAYSSVQLYLQDYLDTLPSAERIDLARFALPLLIASPQLSRLRICVIHKGRAKRKEQAFAVVKDLPALVGLGRRRYKWLADLDHQTQQIADGVARHQITLPALFQCKDLDNKQDLTFRVWDRTSWIKAHPKGYAPDILRRPVQDAGLFLQLVGELPETPWFLHTAAIDALKSTGRLNPQASQYMRDCNVPVFTFVGNGLLSPRKSLANLLPFARRSAAGIPEDSRVLFGVEPLLAAAAVGLFALVCLTQTGMRMGELQQVTGDKTCMKIGRVPTFDENGGQFHENSTNLFFWLLYPKGDTERQPYPVTPFMQEALKVWMQVHERFCGPFQPVPADGQHFSHVRRFPGKHLFVFQWNGKHLASSAIEMCMDFLLLEHLCLDSSGKPARITAHVLRHGVAGYLRQQGVPLEDIAALLHQVNLIVTDYYSQLSPQELFAKVGPFLTRLGELAEIDPTTLRTVGDIEQLAQDALKRFGVLRRIPGGTCAVFTPCEVQFRCASCPAYIPDPSRRAEVREKIIGCARTAQFLMASGDFLQADVQKAHGRQWERVEKEMQALAAIQLAAPPFESALKEFGLDHLDDIDDEWLLTLKPQPQLPPGGNQTHV